jgi:hypothetical protein
MGRTVKKLPASKRRRNSPRPSQNIGKKAPSQEHEDFLMKMGAHPSQRSSVGVTGINPIPNYKTRETFPTSDVIMPIDPYQGLSVAEKIAATRSVNLGQMYNKGGLQVISKNDDPTTGRRRS